MSSIALSGNAAGAGVFTIASPNSASSVTLTLPTTAGTLATTNNISSVIQPISASIATNAITVSASALSLDFRSTTLTSGTVTTVSGTPSSLTIASTDSFGLVTAYGNQRIVILAINNAGTIELAASAIYGGVSLDETGVITTAATATTATAIKAANVRTGVAYRVIGFVDATFTTATGWGSLAEVQGTGGQALTAMSSLGYGQTWQNLTASRSVNVNYYNTTGKPIYVYVSQCYSTSGVATYILLVNGVQVSICQPWHTNSFGEIDGLVPAGAVYQISAAGSFDVYYWTELR
jgi:hypothetical protein